MSDSLDVLLAGALRWVRGNSGYLDSDSGRAELPAMPRVKAILQLALLHYHWARIWPADEGRAGVTAFIDGMWQRPGFARLIAEDRRFAQTFGMMYAALVPAGSNRGVRESMLAKLAADGFLSPEGKSPYDCLATRYYADLAGVSHGFAPYLELYRSSPLGSRAALERPLELDVCNVTHTIFYLSHFGFRDSGLDYHGKNRALGILRTLTENCVAKDEWDLTGKLMLAQYCLGGDPLGTALGNEALGMIGQAQVPSGAIPGRSSAQRVPESASALEFFRKSYQTTVTMALMSLIMSPPG